MASLAFALAKLFLKAEFDALFSPELWEDGLCWSSILCYMDRREGDAAENLNIRSSRGASEYSLIFQTDLPCARVQFIFSNCPAGRPSTVWFFKLSCRAAESNWQAGRGRSIRRPDEVAVGNRVRSPDRSAEAGLSIGQGRPAGQFEKPNCKRPPGRTVWKNELY